MADIEPRDELIEAQLGLARSWSQPGTWFDGAESRAIVAEVRVARAAADLPPWTAPSTVEGLISDDHPLSTAVVDAIWRLTNHPATTTAEWYRGIVEQGVAPEQYVELVALVASASAMQVWAAATGSAPLELQPVVPGEPTRESIEAEVHDHWVPTRAMGGANVLKALSAVPAAFEMLVPVMETHYVPHAVITNDVEWGRESDGGLNRMQIELLAARTSALNECFY